jgi:hypothetical protein
MEGDGQFYGYRDEVDTCPKSDDAIDKAVEDFVDYVGDDASFSSPSICRLDLGIDANSIQVFGYFYLISGK